MAIQAQLQALAERGVAGRVAAATMSTKVARSQVFDRTSSKVSEFVITYRLHIRIKMREAVVEEQI